MPIVSATVVQPQTYVRLSTSWADMPTVDYVRFVRVDPVTCDETVVRVHTAYDATGEYILLSCDDTAVVWDTEAPLETNLTYRVEGLGTAVTVTSVVVNIDNNGENHLKDPLNPCHDLRVAVCIGEPGCTDSNPGTFYIGHTGDLRRAHSINLLPVNSDTPITISRRRQKPESLLALGTQECEDAEAMDVLMDPGSPLLWQSLPGYCMPDRYISVSDYTEDRLGADQRLEVRTHMLPYLQTSRPVGPGNGPCGVRWNDLCDEFGTWDDLAAAGMTWNDLLLGNATGMFPAARRWIDVETEFTNWLDVETSNGDWQDVRDGT